MHKFKRSFQLPPVVLPKKDIPKYQKLFRSLKCLTLGDFLGCFVLGRLKHFPLFLAVGTNSEIFYQNICLSSEMQLGFGDLIM